MLRYKDMLEFNSFGDRLNYLQLKDIKHESPRSISNAFYKTTAWQICRENIIRRDMGCDLGVLGCDISGPIYVHHINPLTEDDIIFGTYKLFDPDNLITVSMETHNMIHYGKKIVPLVERKAGDTKLW